TPSANTWRLLTQPPPRIVPLKVVIPLRSVAASEVLPPGQMQRPELNRTTSWKGTPTSGWPWQFFRNTLIVIPVPANVSPVPAGEIVMRSLAILVKVTTQYDESGQTMSAAATPAKHAVSAVATATMSAFLNILRHLQKNFQRVNRDGSENPKSL